MNVRLLGADQAPLLARAYYAEGDPGPIVAALAQVPELLEVVMPFLGTAFGPTAIPWRTKEIVILRTSSQLDCRYCIQSHTTVALDAGLSVEEVRALRVPMLPDGVFAEPGERALIRWIDAVAGSTGPVPAPLAEGLADHYDDAGVVELTLLAGVTMMLNRFCTALELPTSPDVLARLVAEDLQ